MRDLRFEIKSKITVFSLETRHNKEKARVLIQYCLHIGSSAISFQTAGQSRHVLCLVLVEGTLPMDMGTC